MIIGIVARHTEGPEPFGSWLWFTAMWVTTGDAFPLPTWYCTNAGEPKVITTGWLETPRPNPSVPSRR